MFGFLLGAMCVAGMGVMARRRRHWRAGYGGGCGYERHGYHGYHGYHGHPGPWSGPDGPEGPPWRGRGPGGWTRGRLWRGGVYRILRVLETTPSQEKVIREELNTLFSTLGDHREEWRASRRDVAQAIRGESFDATAMGELFGRHDERLTAAREAVMEALGRIHAVLDEVQRERLADILDRGNPWHPFRGGAA